MSVIAGSFVSLLASMGSILNLIVIGTLWVRRKKLTPVELCIFNMSIAGLIPSIVSYPMYASSCFADKWIYGYVACVVDGFVVYFFGMVGIATLVVIAVIRLISTVRTCAGYTKAIKSLNHRHALIGSCLTYLYASIWTIPPFFGWGKYGLEPTKLNCAVRWNQLSASYFFTVFAFGYVSPLIMIIFCYVRMSRLMKGQTVPNRGSFIARNITNRRLKTDKLLLKFGVVTCAAFFFMWTPYAVVSFLAYFDLHMFLTKTASLFPSLFAKTSVLVNPIIYFFMVKRFRNDATLWLSSWRMTSLDMSTSMDREMCTLKDFSITGGLQPLSPRSKTNRSVPGSPTHLLNNIPEDICQTRTIHLNKKNGGGTNNNHYDDDNTTLTEYDKGNNSIVSNDKDNDTFIDQQDGHETGVNGDGVSEDVLLTSDSFSDSGIIITRL